MIDEKHVQIIDTSVKKIGGSTYVLIPKGLITWLNAQDVSRLKIQTEKGKHGNYLSIWNPEA